MVGLIRRWQQRHWRERSKAERVELQSMVSWHAGIWVFPLSWLALPLTSGLHRRPVPMALGGLLLALALLQCAAAARVLRPALDDYLGRAELPPRALRVPTVLLGLALATIVALAAGRGADPITTRFAIGAVLMPFGMPYALAVPVRTFLHRAAGLSALIVAALTIVHASGLGLFATLMMTAFAVGFCLAAGRCGAWTLAVLWEAERAREVEARLAVAEERLRFGRDLHDVLGRNLSVISLKSELAVQLARRGRPEAVEQMIEVQRIAQESQREVRDVVRGYREADLVVELAGAQGVLMAAGIDCEVRAEAAKLPAEVQSALGWVVREAATNAVRHSGAATCDIEVQGAAERVRLVITDDGRGVGSTPPGSGLTGLGERLAAAGGTLTSGPVPGGGFRVTAELPVEAGAEGDEGTG